MPSQFRNVGGEGAGPRQVEDDGVEGIGNQRPENPALFLDQLLDLGVRIFGLGLEVAAESGFGVGDEDRRIERAVVADQQRLVVGQKFREQRDEEDGDEDP